MQSFPKNPVNKTETDETVMYNFRKLISYAHVIPALPGFGFIVLGAGHLCFGVPFEAAIPNGYEALLEGLKDIAYGTIILDVTGISAVTIHPDRAGLIAESKKSEEAPDKN